MPIHEVAYWNAMVGGHAMYMLRILLIILNRCPKKGFKKNVVLSNTSSVIGKQDLNAGLEIQRSEGA